MLAAAHRIVLHARNCAMQLTGRLRLGRAFAAWKRLRFVSVVQAKATLQEQLRGMHDALLDSQHTATSHATERRLLVEHTQRMMSASH